MAYLGRTTCSVATMDMTRHVYDVASVIGVDSTFRSFNKMVLLIHNMSMFLCSLFVWLELEGFLAVVFSLALSLCSWFAFDSAV